MATTEQLQLTGMSLGELIPARFTEVWFLDTEFVALDGEPNIPVSLCAYELRSKRKVEMFFDRRHENPFTNPDALFPATASTFSPNTPTWSTVSGAGRRA